MRQLKINKSITNRDSDSLEKYLSEITRENLLTVDEEVELAQRIREGDRKALDKLTKANLRFVVSVAKQYQNYGLSLSDLINEGNIGLIKAAERFDDTRGFKFISYAVWWIRQSILQAIAEHSRLVKLPFNKLGTASKLHRESAKFEQAHERNPSASELAEQTNLPEEKIYEVLNSGNDKHISVDAPFSQEEDSSLLDIITDENAPQADMQLIKESLLSEIRIVLATLKARERQIIEASYGINQPERTLEEIAQESGLTRERVRQIKEKAIRTLRKSTKNKILKAYLGQ